MCAAGGEEVHAWDIVMGDRVIGYATMGGGTLLPGLLEKLPPGLLSLGPAQSFGRRLPPRCRHGHVGRYNMRSDGKYRCSECDRVRSARKTRMGRLVLKTALQSFEL